MASKWQMPHLLLEGAGVEGPLLTLEDDEVVIGKESASVTFSAHGGTENDHILNKITI
jgi:hypothetical protein